MTLVKLYDQSQKYAQTEIIVEDDNLLALLRHALSYHPWYRHSAGRMTLHSPYQPWIHTWESLKALANNDESTTVVADLYGQLKDNEKAPALMPLTVGKTLTGAMSDLKLLLEQVRATPGLDRCFGETQDKTETITFDILWTLFPPGELVFSTVYMKQPQIFIVRECQSYPVDSKRGKTWTLECWSYDWNGTSFKRVPVEFTFNDFPGRKSISSLQCHPLKYHKDDETTVNNLKEKLIERGKKFCKLCLRKPGQQLFEYNGSALSRGTGIRPAHNKSSQNTANYLPQSAPSKFAPKKLMIKNDHVMVDFSSYMQHGPQFIDFPPMGDIKYGEEDECRCSVCMTKTALRDNQKMHYDGVENTAEFEETQYLICPARVLGYHLNGKSWVELDVTIVAEVKNINDVSSFEKLELNKIQKDLVKTLVDSHARGIPFMRDLMKGKGNGLVILLHGPPGVGKTLTAESVAKASGKPLVSISVSDIGLKPSEVEHNLGVLFELAAMWRAILLFDEADVFLESRSSHTSSLDRNALVSVLLRVLEYYDGILILTTNRIRTFDIAVQSRVNFAITYKNLDDKQKRNIFLSFIDQLTDENCQNKEQLRSWLDEEDNLGAPPFKRLNGRQIRNVLFSAASIASREGGRLKLDHIKKLLRETQKFQEDVHSMVESARKDAEVVYSRNS